MAKLFKNTEALQDLLITLQTKATPTGEDVTVETNDYTAKLASLETALTALETELQGKSSVGSRVTTVSVSNRTGAVLYGFDATGAPLLISPGQTGEFLEGIVTIPSINNMVLTGNYVACGYNLYKFLTPGSIEGDAGGGAIN